MLSNTRFGSAPPARHDREPEPAPKLWKAMHHPKWVVHPEADAFFAMGKYKFAISSRRGTPESLICDIKVGDRIIVQPQTMVRNNGQRLKKPKKSNLFRYGTITTESRLEEDQMVQQRLSDNPLYSFCVDWDDSFVPSDPTIINKPFKTFTLIK